MRRGDRRTVLNPAHKVEGVWPITTGADIDLLLVADPDDRAVPAPLLEAVLSV